MRRRCPLFPHLLSLGTGSITSGSNYQSQLAQATSSAHYSYPITSENLDFATIPLEIHHASIIDQRNRTGQRKIDSMSGNCITNHPNDLLCCLLKCCPRKRNGTRERRTATSGLRAPHGPTPPLNSFQITIMTPLVVTSSSSSSVGSMTT